jgi:hypothetical protein
MRWIHVRARNCEWVRVHGWVGRQGPGESTSLNSQTFTFATVLFYCVHMWEAALQPSIYKALYWPLLRHDPRCSAHTARFWRSWAWWCLAALPAVDLWAVKDSQINALSIPDRIRGLHLHTILTSHTTFVSSQPSWVRFGEGKKVTATYPSPTWQHKGSPCNSWWCYLVFNI